MKFFEFARELFSLFHKYNYYNDRETFKFPPSMALTRF